MRIFVGFMPEKREYEDFEINFKLKEGSRKELRGFIVNMFLAEKGGYWKDEVKHVTRYKYFVETIRDGRKIYLLRPTFLNKGIDFQVWVERLDGEKDKKPSHKSIFEDLKDKKQEDPIKFKELLVLIDRVWKCEDPENILEQNELEFRTGWPVELFLKVLKWLFVEQDITYWNYDGRSMLKRAIFEKLE